MRDNGIVEWKSQRNKLKEMTTKPYINPMRDGKMKKRTRKNGKKKKYIYMVEHRTCK